MKLENLWKIKSFGKSPPTEKNKTMSSPDPYGKHADSWWKKYFPDSEEVPAADLCKALRTDSTFGSGGDESERDVEIVIKEVIGVVRRSTRAPKPPSLETHMSQAASVYMMACDDDEFYDTSTDESVSREDFINFAKRCGPLNNIVKRSVESFIVNGDILPWFHGLTKREIAMGRLKRAFERTKEGLFLVRTTDHAQRNFVISVIVRSKKTGKLRDRHELIHNNGDEGFSKFPPGQPGNESFKTLSEFLENYRTTYRLGVTRDVFNYLDSICNS